MPLSQHIIVFTSLEAPRVPSFRDFKLGFTLQAWLIKSLAIDKESESEVTQSCLTLCDPMDYSLTGSSVHGIFQARILEWVSISFSRRSSWHRDQTQVSRVVGRRFTFWATREVDTCMQVSTTNEHLPSNSTMIKSCCHCCFSTPVKGIQGGGQNETLCALEKAGKTGLQIDISGADFMSLILISPLSREAQKSFMMTTVPHD